jgi:AcrR family transcriptional regulator
MADQVKTTREYRSPTRDRQRAATRAAIVAAATRQFVESGYGATTISAIAEAAEVSPETVYVVFGTKRELLRAVVVDAAAGDFGAGAVLGADLLDQVRAEPDQRRRLELMGGATRNVLRRVAPLDEVVRAAAVSDPEIAALQREHELARRRDVRALVELLAEAGPLRMPVNAAADVMWALSRSTDLYRSLTVDRGWSDARAFAALNDALIRVLLPD